MTVIQVWEYGQFIDEVLYCPFVGKKWTAETNPSSKETKSWQGRLGHKNHYIFSRLEFLEPFFKSACRKTQDGPPVCMHLSIVNHEIALVLAMPAFAMRRLHCWCGCVCIGIGCNSGICFGWWLLLCKSCNTGTNNCVDSLFDWLRWHASQGAAFFSW